MTRFSMAPEVARKPIGPRGAVVFSLDYPPTAGDVEALRQWQLRTNWAVLEKRPARMPGPISMLIEIEERPGRRIAGQLSQPIIDLCVQRGVIDGDHRSTLRQVIVRFSPKISGARVTIESAHDLERRL